MAIGSAVRRLALAVSMAAAAAATPMSAQEAHPGMVLGPTPAASSPILRTGLPAPDADRVVLAFGDSRDHRWEGLAIGASVFAIVGILMADALCTPDSGTDNCFGPVIGAGLVSAVVGGVLGGFIGSAIPKRGGESPDE